MPTKSLFKQIADCVSIAIECNKPVRQHLYDCFAGDVATLDYIDLLMDSGSNAKSDCCDDFSYYLN